MRRSRETSIIRDEFGVVVGVTLKADFTAEHEWGIQELKTALGVDDSKLGIDGRLINDAQFMYLLKGKKGMYLYVLGHTYSGIDVSMLDQSSELHCLRDETLSSAWSGRDMCVYAKNPEDVSALEQIYHRAKDKDVAIGLGGSDPRNPFDRQGLSLMIVSRMLPDVLQEVYDGDLDYQNLQIAYKDTGLGEALNKKYRGDNPLDNWFNRPKIRAQWASGHHETRGDTPIAECTKYPVVYWLSTNGSERYYGWYTVEEINQWLDTGKGIIEDEKMKETNNMQVGKWLVIIMAAVALIGCSDTSVDAQYAQRQQMLDAQQVSIDSVEREIIRIRDGNGADMSKWSPDTIKLYQSMQTALVERYAERERMINAMSGQTLEKKRIDIPVEMPADGGKSNK